MNPLKNKQSYYLGSWIITPDQNKLKNKNQEIFIEPKLMEVLHFLCLNAPQIVAIEKVIETCWPNQFISDNPLHKCIARLRKILGDNVKKPEYIKTISKKGYAIVAEIKGMVQEEIFTTSTWHDHVPYLGLSAYDERHQAIFFGRTKALSELKYLLDKSLAIDLPLIMVKGANAVGKTSLIKTAFIPYIIKPDQPFHYQYKEPLCFNLATDAENNENLPKSFIKFLISHHIFNEWLDISSYIKDLHHSLSTLDNLGATQIIGNQQNFSKPSQRVIFIDQIEQIFTQNKPKDMELMLLIIFQLLKTNDYLIIMAIRKGYEQTLNKNRVYQIFKQKILHYDLPPVNTFEITEIVQKPIKVAGLRYEFNTTTFESLDQVIIDDARSLGNILPILNHTLKELSEHCDQKHQLTFHTYLKIGRLKGALTYKIEHILETLTNKQKSLLSANLHHFIQYTPNFEKKYRTVALEINSINDGNLLTLIKLLIDKGLLRTFHSNKNTFVIILHDSLLLNCDFFKHWITQNQLTLSITTEVKTLASQWVANNRKKDYLLSNPYLLEQSHTFIHQKSMQFNNDENQYISSSLKQQQYKNVIKKSALFSLITLLIVSLSLLSINKNNSIKLQQANHQAENLITFMIGELKDKLMPIGKLDLLQIVGQQIIDYYHQRDPSLISKKSQLHYIKALNAMGEVSINKGDMKKGEKYFSQAINLSTEQLALEETHLTALFHKSQSHYWLGYIAYLKNNFAKTEKYWSQYLQISSTLLQKEPENNQWKLEKSYALNNLGTLNYQLNNYEGAEKYFNLSAKLKKKIHESDPRNPTYINDLADTISWQANVLTKKNALIKANEIYQESLELAKTLLDINEDNTVWQYNVALAYYRLAMSHYDLGHLNMVKPLIQDAIDIYEELTQLDQTNQTWVYELNKSYFLLSKVYRHEKDHDNAILHINKALDVQKEFFSTEKNDQNMNVIKMLFAAEHSLNTLNLGQYKTALSHMTKALEKFDRLDNKNYLDIDYFNAYGLFVVAQLQHANQNNDKAKRSLRKAQQILESNIVNSNDKKHMALYIALENNLNLYKHTRRINDYLNEIEYFNPDFLTYRTGLENQSSLSSPNISSKQ